MKHKVIPVSILKSFLSRNSIFFAVICYAYREVTSVVTALTDLRGNIDVTHKEWFVMAVSLGQQINASEPELLRSCRLQTARCNIPGDTPEVYYRRISFF